MDTSVIATRTNPQTATVTATPAAVELHDAAFVFVRARPGLLKIANRILRDPGEAEDVIQETWLRWQGTDRTVVANPGALLRTTTVRLAINVLQSARRRRESSATPWLPEPTNGNTTPEVLAERQNAVEQAVALLLQTLTPNQRAAYVLREAFGYSYDEIGDLLDLTVANARQQVSRAQDRLNNRRHRQHVDAVTHRRLVQAIFTAARTGNLGQLERVLTRRDAPRSDAGTGTYDGMPPETIPTRPAHDTEAWVA
ncbi:sigma-70 family RNA polymerase sigma factor [Streptomyces sp. NPDC092369]|uniref:sigma-70 family RNA polymerase sigma factor n=1 Tax=Streptomyces sp. NPDC092369 TaxID=3366015 RepID=UPI003810B33B